MVLFFTTFLTVGSAVLRQVWLQLRLHPGHGGQRHWNDGRPSGDEHHHCGGHGRFGGLHPAAHHVEDWLQSQGLRLRLHRIIGALGERKLEDEEICVASLRWVMIFGWFLLGSTFIFQLGWLVNVYMTFLIGVGKTNPRKRMKHPKHLGPMGLRLKWLGLRKDGIRTKSRHFLEWSLRSCIIFGAMLAAERTGLDQPIFFWFETTHIGKTISIPFV